MTNPSSGLNNELKGTKFPHYKAPTDYRGRPGEVCNIDIDCHHRQFDTGTCTVAHLFPSPCSPFGFYRGHGRIGLSTCIHVQSGYVCRP